MRESRIRSFAKMISWRFWATLMTMLLVYIFVGEIKIAITVGILEVVIKMALYYVHERAWDKINMGKYELKPFVLWFTGLSGSGKSTLADGVYDLLSRRGCKVERLDGDTVRSIFPQTGFSREERDSHIKRVGFLASMLEKNGSIVVASFISPYKESREFVRQLCGNFVEIYVSASVEECMKRDVKGLYKKAYAGEIKNFTGVNDPYEAPEAPQIIIDAEKQSVEESVREIGEFINKHYL